MEGGGIFLQKGRRRQPENQADGRYLVGRYHCVDQRSHENSGDLLIPGGGLLSRHEASCGRTGHSRINAGSTISVQTRVIPMESVNSSPMLAVPR